MRTCSLLRSDFGHITLLLEFPVALCTEGGPFPCAEEDVLSAVTAGVVVAGGAPTVTSMATLETGAQLRVWGHPLLPMQPHVLFSFCFSIFKLGAKRFYPRETSLVGLAQLLV